MIRQFPLLILFVALLAGAGCDHSHSAIKQNAKDIAPFDPNHLELFYELTVDNTVSLLKNNRDIVIVDFRAPEHFSVAHIAGAINIPFPAPDFEAKVKALDPGAKILIYGYSPDLLIGELNTMDGIWILRRADYRNLYWMRDGYPGWIQAGLTVVNSDGQTVENPPLGPMPVVLPTTEGASETPQK